MKIEIKKGRIGILISVFCFLFLLFGNINIKNAQAAVDDCQAGFTYISGEPQCDGQNFLCAYTTYVCTNPVNECFQSYCRKPADSNECIVSSGDPNCQVCNGYMADGSATLPNTAAGYASLPDSAKNKTYQLYFKDRKVGCKSPYFCVNTGKVNIGGIEKDLYECADQTDARVCAGGKGVDEDGKPKVCPDVDAPCNRVLKDIFEGAISKNIDTFLIGKPELKNKVYFFIVKEILVLPKISGGQDSFGPGTQIYCLPPMVNPDEISKAELKLCYIKKQSVPVIFDIELIGDKYNVDNVDLTKIAPNYECDKGSAFWAVFNNTIGRVIAIVLGLIFAIIALVCTILLILILAFLEWIISMGGLDLNIVSVIWTMLRDIANMFFILILLYIAFNVALRRQGNVTKMLPSFFAAVLLINFSKIICQVVIDFSQFLISFVYGLSALNQGTSATSRGWGIVNYVAQAAGMSHLYNFWQPGFFQIDDKNSMLMLVGTIGVLVLGIIYMIAAVIVYGVAVVLLTYRIVILWILTGVSPLIYAAWGAGMKNWVSKFWSEFLKTAFFAPAMIFCILLSLYVLSPVADTIPAVSGSPETATVPSKAMQALDQEAKIKKNTILDDAMGGTTTKLPADVAKFDTFIQLLFALCFMWAGIVVAKKASIAGSSAVISGAEKLMKQGANWLTMYKPAKAGLKAAGRWGWGKSLESRAGKYLKVFSPTVWKQAAENRRKRRQGEIYTPRVAEMQARLAGTGAFLFGRGRKHKEEKMYAYIQIAQMQNKIAKEIDETNVSSDHIIKLLSEEIIRSHGRLTPSIAGKFIALTDRGDDNDLMKLSEVLGVHTGGRVNIGALEKMMRKTFGDGEDSMNLANRMMESMKRAKYIHLFGGMQYNKEKGGNEFTLDSFDDEIGEEAKRIGINMKALKDGVLDNLEKAASEIEDEITKIKTENPSADTSRLEAIRNIKYLYEERTEASQRGEYNKLTSSQKAQINTGNLYPDGISPDKPEGAKYGGSKGDLAGIISLNGEDVRSLGRFRQGRTYEAIMDNESTMPRIWERIERKVEHFAGMAEQEKNLGNAKRAEKYKKIAENYQKDLEKSKKIMPQLYHLLRREPKDIDDNDQRIEDLQRGNDIF